VVRKETLGFKRLIPQGMIQQTVTFHRIILLSCIMDIRYVKRKVILQSLAKRERERETENVRIKANKANNIGWLVKTVIFLHLLVQVYG
jgi:hypothetical protein